MDSLATPRLVHTCALLVVTCMAVFVASACIPSDPKTYDLGFARDTEGSLYVFVPLCPGATIEKVELSPDRPERHDEGCVLVCPGSGWTGTLRTICSGRRTRIPQDHKASD